MFQGVAQLADVAEPGQRLQEAQRLRQQRQAPRLEAAQEVLGQRLDVLGPLAQRRQVDLEDVEAEEQVVAEAALGDAARQVLVRRGQDADVERLRLVAADRQHLVVLQHAQQLDLHRQRDVGQLVEEDGAAVGQGEQAGARLGGPGEGPADVAEQLALDEVRVEGGDVDRQERPVAAARCSGGRRGRPVPCRCRSRR